MTSAGGPFLDVEGDRASISAELAGPEERMRRLEKHRESDIMVSDPAHRCDAVNLVLWDPNISIVTHWPYRESISAIETLRSRPDSRWLCCID